MDWKDVLGQLKNDPSLPEGSNDEPKHETNVGKSKEKLNIAVEKKGRGGKVATIIYGFTGSDEEVAEVAAKLKKKLGTGGSARGGEILIQGDIAHKVRVELQALGYKC